MIHLRTLRACRSAILFGTAVLLPVDSALATIDDVAGSRSNNVLILSDDMGYGIEENRNPPAWLIKAVDEARAQQPKSWPPGETPLSQAPKAPKSCLRSPDAVP